MPIILDGVIDENVLKDLNKTTKWVYRILKEKNLSLEDVFYAFYAQGKTFIIRKKDLL